MGKWFNQRQWLTRLFWLSSALLFLFSVVSYRISTQLVESFHWVDHTHQVLESLLSLDFLRESARAGFRGYLLQGGQEYYDDYVHNRDQIVEQISAIQKLTTDNVVQQERFKILEPMVKRRLQMMDAAIKAAKSGDRLGASRRMISPESLLLRDQIQQTIDSAENDERRLLMSRRLNTARSLSRSREVVLLGSFLSLLALLAIMRWLRREVHRREEAEAASLQQATVLESVVQSMGDGVVVANEKGEFRMWNPAADRLVGSRSAVKNADETPNYYGFFYADQTTPYLAGDTPLAKAIKGESTTNVEIYVCNERKPEGAWISVTGRPLKDDQGRVRGGVVVFQDATSRKEVEKQLYAARDMALESARFKSEFMANMSHEIRTPMNAIIGMTGLLMETELNAQQNEFAGIVKNAGESLLKIINDILDFSKIEAGKFDMESLHVNIRDTLDDVTHILAEKAQTKGLELACQVMDDVPSEVQGDPTRLRQILLNLLSNAVKFTETGEVVARITMVRETPAQVTLRFSVKDTGMGIPEAVQPRMFQAFSQADGSTTRRFGGTGLGLAISKRMVELMGGEINVISQEGKGSEFWFMVPFKRVFETAVPLPRGELRGLRILIVDDNETNRQILHHQFTSWGMFDGEASSGVEALQLLRGAADIGKPFDIAILDMQMPGMDGLSLAQAIKSDPHLSSTKLFILTSLGNRLKDDTLRDAGVLACLSKPVRQSELFDCLATILAGGELTRTTKVIAAASEPAERVGVRESESRPLRLLLVEDNEANVQVALYQLKKLGYIPDVATDGRKAVDAQVREAYDVILMDCQMPEMDGYQATAEIRRLEKTHTTIIAMTANALERDREKCLAAGMDDYLTKPVTLASLRAMLERWMVPKTPTPESIINWAHLRELTDQDEEAMRRLVGIYVSETEKELAQLSVEIKAGHTSEVRRLSHGSAGAGAAYGMTAMVVPMRAIEHPAEDGRLDEATVHLEKAQVVFSKILQEWHAYLNTKDDRKVA